MVMIMMISRDPGNKSETVMAGKWLPWASKPPQNGKSYCFLMATWPSIKGWKGEVVEYIFRDFSSNHHRQRAEKYNDSVSITVNAILVMKIGSWGSVYEAWNRVKDTGITWTLANFRETPPRSRDDHPKDHHRDKFICCWVWFFLLCVFTF